MTEYFSYSTLKGLLEIQDNIPFVSNQGIDKLMQIKKDSGNWLYNTKGAFNFYQEYPDIFENFLPVSMVDDLDMFLSMIVSSKPDWLAKVKYGRSAVNEALLELGDSENLIQIFEELELFNNNDETVSIWWAYLDFIARGQDNESFNKRRLGLLGESLTQEFEKNIIEDLGIKNSIENIAIDFPNAGYDILSWRINNNKEHKIYIEAKYNSRDNESFFLTRNEYNKAIEYKDNYFIYLWLSKDHENPIILNFKDIEKNTPKDRGGSEWKEAFISLN